MDGRASTAQRHLCHNNHSRHSHNCFVRRSRHGDILRPIPRVVDRSAEPAVLLETRINLAQKLPGLFGKFSECRFRIFGGLDCRDDET